MRILESPMFSLLGGLLIAESRVDCVSSIQIDSGHHPQERERMEKLPGGANFKRAAMLWEAGLHIAGNPETPYGGNRDVCITVGSGSGEAFTPWLRLATGSAILAKAVAAGGASTPSPRRRSTRSSTRASGPGSRRRWRPAIAP